MYIQTKRFFEKISIPLRESESSLENLVQYTPYITDINQLEDFYRGKVEFSQDNATPGSLIEVAGLPGPDYLIEIKWIGVIS